MNFSAKRLETRPSDAPDYKARMARLAPNEAEEDRIDIRALIEPVFRWKWLILVIAILSTSAGLFVVSNLKPTYTAAARVIFDPERLQIIDLDSVVANADVSTTGLENQVEILRSAALLERVVDSLQLANTPEFNPALRTDPPNAVERLLAVVPLPGRVLELLERLNFELPDRAALAALTPEAVRLNALDKLVDDLRLRRVPNSRVIEVGLTSTNPVLAATVVNKVVEEYIQVQIDRKRDDVAAATELLGVRVQDLENRLNAAEEAVEIARLEMAQASGFASTLTGERLELLTERLSEARADLATQESRLARATSALDDPAAFAIVAEFRAAPGIQNFRAREAEFVDQLAALRATAGQANPAIARLEARLAEVQRSLRSEAEVIVAGMAEDAATARGAVATLEAELASLQARALDQSRAEIKVERLERDAEATRLIYETFLNRMKEASEQASLQTSDARILTRALAPESPDSSSARKILALAGAGGLALGLGLVFLIENLNNAFRSGADVERRTGLPVLAAVPNAGRARQPKDMMAFLLGNPHSSLGESIRNLRTSILYSNIDNPPKVVMFTSSLPSEGKTTTALLTAITSQQMGRSAVIVDCDLRRRTLGRAVPGPEGGPGIFAVLQGTATLDEALSTEPDSGLSILTAEPSGGAHVNPADILGSTAFARLVDQLRQRFDLVVLDTPPTLVVSDARILCQLADVVVYLVKWNKTKRRAVLEGLQELASVNSPTAGIAFSLIDERAASKYSDTEYYYKRRYKQYLKH